METSDALEPVEAELSRPAPSTAPQKEGEAPAAPTGTAPPSSTAPPSRATGERDEVRVDDRLELASQQSTETGSLDGSCRGPLNSSITSTTSTLVPGMLEEAEEEEEEEEVAASPQATVPCRGSVSHDCQPHPSLSRRDAGVCVCVCVLSAVSFHTSLTSNI